MVDLFALLFCFVEFSFMGLCSFSGNCPKLSSGEETTHGSSTAASVVHSDPDEGVLIGGGALS